MKILADASLPDLERFFPSPFVISRYYHIDEVQDLLSDHNILLIRSTLPVSEKLLKKSQLQCLATVSSGIDHIDIKALKSREIELITAHGSNAQSVADYVVACIAALKINLKWNGNKVSVVGYGAVGKQVSTRLDNLGLSVLIYDPFINLEQEPFNKAIYSDLFNCDLLCLHPNLHNSKLNPSKNFINKNFLANLNSNCVIINAARGEVVDEQALIQTKHICYCTDVYHHEPSVNPEIIDRAWICTPHIAGHAVEAREQAMIMVSKKIHHLLGIDNYSKDLDPTNKSSGQRVEFDDLNSHLVLDKYNPMIDTAYLKQATNLTEAFVRLRKAHTYRHHFE